MFLKRPKAYCRPCAEGLKADGQRLTALPGKTEKRICACCKRRRFTLMYTNNSILSPGIGRDK